MWRVEFSWFYTGIGVYFVAIVGVTLGLFVLLKILSSEERPSFSFAWILTIIFIPYIGIPAYLIFGNRKLKRVAEAKSLEFDESCPGCRIEPLHQVARVMTAFEAPRPSSHNWVEFIPDGVAAFERVIAMIDSAERTVYCQTFILYDDAVGKAVVDKLAEKARAGVKVYLLLDAFGSWMTSGRFVDPVREAGGHVGVFMRLNPFQRKWSLNLRNHRKALIVDESKGLMGGMNLGIQYMGPEPDPERWVDTVTYVEGPVVYDLFDEFVSDWEFATNERLQAERPDRWGEADASGGTVAQVVPSGPDVRGDPMYAALIAGILNAQRRVWIVTPYFIPDDGLMRVLGVAARMKIDVRILIPSESNHPLADLTRGNFLRRINRDGGKVYYYPGGMVHAKNLLIDDDFALSGSVNLDMRSLMLNFEIAMFFYTEETVKHISDWMEGMMDRSEIREIRPVTRPRRFLEQVCFLISPLL